MDVTGGGRSARLDNFKAAEVWTGRGKSVTKARGGQDKGQRSEMAAFVEAVRTDAPMPIGLDSLLATTRATIAVGESLLSGRGERGVSGTGTSKLGWYARRLGRMSPAEIGLAGPRAGGATGVGAPPGTPAVTSVRCLRWLRRGRRVSAGSPPCFRRAPPGWCPTGPVAAIIEDADRLLKGEWEMLGVVRTDMESPDWFRDPVTGRRSAPEAYAFSLDQRDESAVGNIKQVWEVNRLQHLTLLAAAWYLTGVDAYAVRVAEQLRSWWRENPFLSGINWTSGIELGVRLINLAWIRRLLDGWPGVADLFERNDLALRQIFWHQQYLAAFESRGSSANNHVIAEAAGQLVASCAFPWFDDSERWRRDSSLLLERELDAQHVPVGDQP